MGDPDRPELIAALDAVATLDENGLENSLRPGDFAWLEAGKASRVFKNNGDKEARLISFALKPQGSAE